MADGGRIELFLLGGIELRGIGRAAADSLLAQPKVTALLSLLALAPEMRPQRRDRLVGMLWPELDQAHARTALRKAIHALRKSLGSEAVMSRGDEELGLEPPFWCDAVELGAAYSQAQLARAVELYKGELMPGFFLPDCGEFERWLDTERMTARESASAAALGLATTLEGDKQLTHAGRIARKAVVWKWDDERVLRRAMQLLDRIGDRAGALRIFDDFAVRMRKELGAEPADETRRLASTLRGVSA